MKKVILLLSVCSIVCFQLFTVQHTSAASADESTAWIPVETNVFFISSNFFNPYTPGWAFGIFDIDDTGNYAPIIQGNTTSATLEFFQMNTGWKIFNSGIEILNLGDSNDFGFFWLNTAASIPTFDFVYEYSILNNQFAQYLLDPENGTTQIMVANALPVPVSKSILLLGSGIIALIGFNRRKSRDQ